MPHPSRYLSRLLLLAISLGLAACGPASAGNAPAPTATAAPAVGPTEPALAPPLPGSYAALGASETYGVGATPHTHGYAYRVAHTLHAGHFIDVGISGTTLDAGYDSELTRALASRPSLATVFFGVNDIRAAVPRAAFLRDLHDLVATLRRAHAQVLIIGIPDLSLLPAVQSLHFGGIHEIVASWNSGMQQVARSTGAHFLDLRAYTHELATHPNYIAPDGLHPSNAGHKRLAQVVVAKVRQLHLWSAP